MTVSNAIIAVPFGFAMLVLFYKGLETSNRFFYKNYQGNDKERFRDNLALNLYLFASVGCLMVVAFSMTLSESVLPYIPCAVGISVVILPVGIVGSYWQSYITNKMFGGFMPTVSQQYGFADPEPEKEHVAADMHFPRKSIILAGIAGLLSFSCIFIGLTALRWNGSDFTWLLFRSALGGLAGFGTFMMVGAITLSRRIQYARKQRAQGKD